MSASLATSVWSFRAEKLLVTNARDEIRNRQNEYSGPTTRTSDIQRDETSRHSDTSGQLDLFIFQALVRNYPFYSYLLPLIERRGLACFTAGPDHHAVRSVGAR